MNSQLPSLGRSSWFHSGSVHLGVRWAPCPAISSISEMGPDHLSELIPRQADLLSPLPRGGTHRLLAVRSSEPEDQQPKSLPKSLQRKGWWRCHVPGEVDGGQGVAPRSECGKEHKHSPFLPPRAVGQKQLLPPGTAPTWGGGAGRPSHLVGHRCTHLGRRPAGRFAAIAPRRQGERAGPPPLPESRWAGSGSQARSHWSASQ